MYNISNCLSNRSKLNSKSDPIANEDFFGQETKIFIRQSLLKDIVRQSSIIIFVPKQLNKMLFKSWLRIYSNLSIVTDHKHDLFENCLNACNALAIMAFKQQLILCFGKRAFFYNKYIKELNLRKALETFPLFQMYTDHCYRISLNFVCCPSMLTINLPA